MNKSVFIKIYIIPSMIISPMFSLSCNSWFSIWMSMEFNLMTFIPLLIYYNEFYKEIAMKYFIVQAISSSTLLMASNFLFINSYSSININNFMINLINLSLLMKMGSAPFHLWFINIMKNMNWLNCLILSTWQKIIPMMILMYLMNNKLIYFIILISSITGTMFGLNHQSLRLIMAYSSINHISWMLMNTLISETSWMLYFLSYSITNFSIMMILNHYKIYYINQFFFNNNMKINKIYLLINFISLSSLPPTFGFLMKWLTINMSIWLKYSIIILLMIILSIMTFIYYLRICISFLMNINLSNKISLINKFYNLNNLSLFTMIFTSFFLNLWLFSMWIF